MKSIDTFDKHRREPNKTLDSYVKEKRLILGQEIKNVKKVYLDTKFWLLLRDAYLMREQSQLHTELLSLLIHLVNIKSIICPISQDIIIEISKQSDNKTLRKSIEILDILSKGISLISLYERHRLELLSFVRKNISGEDSIYTIDEFAWTKAPYVMGFTYPHMFEYSKEDNLAIQKAFFDQMWTTSLVDMVEVMGIDNLHKMPKLQDISADLNEGKNDHKDENNTFEQMFLSELAGILDFYIPDFKDIIQYMYQKETGHVPSKEELANDNSGQMLANLIYHAFRLKKITKELPSFRISAGLHSALRWDTKRKIKPNDIHDLHHAVSAIPYCDLFFTERSLKDLVTRKNLAYDKLYNCTIAAHLDEAIQSLKQIQGKLSP